MSHLYEVLEHANLIYSGEKIRIVAFWRMGAGIAWERTWGTF